MALKQQQASAHMFSQQMYVCMYVHAAGQLINAIADGNRVYDDCALKQYSEFFMCSFLQNFSWRMLSITKKNCLLIRKKMLPYQCLEEKYAYVRYQLRQQQQNAYTSKQFAQLTTKKKSRHRLKFYF